MNAQASLATYETPSTAIESSNLSRTLQDDRKWGSLHSYLKIQQSAANEGTLPHPLQPEKPPPTLSPTVSAEQLSPAELLAEWSGCVTSIQEAYSFSATLTGVTGEGVKGEEEDAIIPISDVSESDKELLRPGNFFRLCVMYEIGPSGQPRRYTQVIFRRLPAYRNQDLDEALERGRKLARGLRVG